MTELPRLPEGRSLTPEERNHFADAFLDAREAGRLSEYEDEFDREQPVLDGIPPWSEACPGVSVCTRAAELDQLSEHARHVDEVDHLFHELLGHDVDDEDD